jgi:hypothetical protein
MEETPNDRRILEDALAFHGHNCWASTMGVRMGLAALGALAWLQAEGGRAYGWERGTALTRNDIPLTLFFLPSAYRLASRTGTGQ